VPAAFAVAAQEHQSGDRLLDAVLAGYEVVVESGLRFAGAALYRNSWWPTALFGALGAAAASSILLDLDEDALVNAMAIAAAGLGGLLSDAELSEGHYLLLGNAAARGVEAAYQSGAGMVASRTLLNGPAARALGREAGPPSREETSHLSRCAVKAYPCARPLHAVIRALGILRERGVDLAAVDEVEVRLPEPLLRFVSKEVDVAGPSEAAASAAYVIAAVIGGRESDVGFYRGAALSFEHWNRLVTLVPDEDLHAVYPERWGATVTTREPGGRTSTVTAFEEAPADLAALVHHKFRQNTADLDGPSWSDWVERLLNLDGLPDVAPLRTEAFGRRP
jgi:2-methylcitrate dehydratase PrpD